MELHVIGSGSSGNCYIFSNKDTALVLECGIRFDLVKRALDFNLKKVCGALLTHEHGDHCKYVDDFLGHGMDVYTSAGTIEAMGKRHHRLKPMDCYRPYMVGQFKVIPFDVRHDVKEPFGFVISHPEMGNTLFITDSLYVPHRFENLNNILIETNYSEAILEQKLNAGTMLPFLRDRVVESHMSLETAKEVLHNNDLSAVNNIVLIHLSARNSCSDTFRREVGHLTGKNVHIASKGLKINFGKTPY